MTGKGPGTRPDAVSPTDAALQRDRSPRASRMMRKMSQSRPILLDPRQAKTVHRSHYPPEGEGEEIDGWEPLYESSYVLPRQPGPQVTTTSQPMIVTKTTMNNINEVKGPETTPAQSQTPTGAPETPWYVA